MAKKIIMRKYYNYKDVFEFFNLLNESECKYVVMRNYESMHEEKNLEDAEILVESVDEFISVTGAIPKMWPENKSQLVVFIDEAAVPLYVRNVGDNYYDPKWEKDLMNSRRIADNGPWYVLSQENYYYSLCYHALLRKEKISDEYLEKIKQIIVTLEINNTGSEADIIKALKAFMISKGYVYTTQKASPARLKKHRKGVDISTKIRMSLKNANRLIKLLIKRFARSMGGYDALYSIYYNSQKAAFDKSKGRFKDIDRLANYVHRKAGENVYSQLAQRRVYNYIGRYMEEIEHLYIYEIKDWLEKSGKRISNTVFTMWWQGMDDMPDVVKVCIDSLSKLEKNIVFLSERNVKEYVYLPDYIWEKFDKGIISKAHMSDIIRVAVLALYGGVWCDATVYIAETVPRYMTDELFVFKQSPQLREVRSYANWWLAAPKGHELIVRQLCALLVYWKHENQLLDYYIFHIFWKKIVDSSMTIKKELDNIPSRITDSTHLLLQNYANEYEDNKWKEFKAISPVFKCTYKWKGLSSYNSFYVKLCQGILP